MKTLHVNLGENSYNIYVGAGLASRANELFNLNRRVMIVTDDGVPAEYSKTLASMCKEAHIFTFPQGETSKTVNTVTEINRKMMELGFDRHDCVVAVGGGVVGDLAGFASSCYMRGVDFYNIPTTVLSQVDSSVGGKTGVNLDGIKNIIGAFKQPNGVIIDVVLLKTLPPRQISNGLSEAVKMALTFDIELFEKLENGNVSEELEDIITRSVALKIAVVEKDEKETGLRKVLNFGHTVGHGIESLGMDLYHGECVALGMTYMCSPDVKARLIPVLKNLNLPTEADFDREKALTAISHDKKSQGNTLDAVFVDRVGEFSVKKVTLNDISSLLTDK